MLLIEKGQKKFSFILLDNNFIILREMEIAF